MTGLSEWPNHLNEKLMRACPGFILLRVVVSRVSRAGPLATARIPVRSMVSDAVGGDSPQHLVATHAQRPREGDHWMDVSEPRWSSDQDAHVRLAASHFFRTGPRRNVRPDSEVPKT